MVFTLARNPNGTRPLLASYGLCRVYGRAFGSNGYSPTRESGYGRAFWRQGFRIDFLALARGLIWLVVSGCL